MNGYKFFAPAPLSTRTETETTSSTSGTESNHTIRGNLHSREPDRFRRRLPATAVQDVHIHDLIVLAGTAEPISTIGTESFGHQSGHLADTICRTPYDVIGQGGSFVAKRIKIDCKCNGSPYVVVKSPRITSRTQDVGQGIRKRLKHILFELRVLTHEPLIGHNNIVRFLGITWEDDPYEHKMKWPAVLLEYADVGTLDRAIGNNSIPRKLRLSICLDVASGLNALHECGIIHCDIKPSNVLLFTDKRMELLAKLADFGLSLADSGEGTRLSGGTPGWTAPEWKSYIPADRIAKADIYSFGLMVWSVITMTRDPFQGIGIPISTHQQEIEALKISDGKLLARVSMHIKQAATVSPRTAMSAGEVIHVTLRTDPNRRDLMRAIELLKRGIPEEDARLGADEDPKGLAAIRESRMLLDSIKQSLNGASLTKEHVWRICTFSQLITGSSGVSNRELNELKEQCKDLTGEEFFGRYCKLLAKPKQTERTLQRVDEMRVLTRPADDGSNRKVLNVDIEAADISKFSATHIQRLHLHIQDMVLDSLTTAAAAGSPDSALYLSIFYTNVRFDPVKACEYILKAARLGSSSGMYLCHRLHKAHGIPLNVSFPERAGWFHAGICWGSQFAYKQALEDDPQAVWGAKIILGQQGSRFGDLPFDQAAATGPFRLVHDDLEKVKTTIQSLQQHVDAVVIAGENGDKLLHWAAAIHNTPFQRHKDILPGLLTELHANPNVTNAKGETPLLTAVKAGNGHAILELLKAGADPTISSHSGQVPLHWLWTIPEYDMGDPTQQATALPLLAKFLSQGKAGSVINAVADALSVRLHGGAGKPDHVKRLQTYILSEMPAGTPLHWAVQRRSIPTIKALLAQGAKPSATSIGADTRGTAQVFPLSAAHLAAGMHDYDILELFIAAEPDCLQSLHPCPLATAIDGNMVSGYANGRFERMVRHGAAYLEQTQKTFRLFWEQGYHSLRKGFQSVVDNGMMKIPPSPLILAVQSGQADVVECLLETPYKKDINLKCGVANFDPLQESIKQRSNDVYFALRRHGANPLNTTLLSDGLKNNLCNLAEFGNSSLAIAQDLISAGVSVSAGNLFNYSPLRDALRNGFFPLARLFLDNGADPNELRSASCLVHHQDQDPVDLPTTILGCLIIDIGRHKLLPLKWLLEEDMAARLPIPLQTTVCPKAGYNVFHQLGFSREDGREEGISVEVFHVLRRAFPDKELLNAAAQVEESTAMGDKKLTPLLMAVQSFDILLLKAMMTDGADPTVDLGGGLTVLDIAREHLAEFESCLRQRAFPRRLMPSDVSSLPKMLANRREIVKELEKRSQLSS